MKFDELNQLKRFFAVMDVEDRDKRVSFARMINEALLYVFILIQAEIKLGNKIDPNEYYTILENRMRDAYERSGLIPNEDYVPQIAKDIIDTTLRHTDDPYFVSKDRAVTIAQNEANTAYNLKDYDDAVASGKKYKTWRAEMDDRTRLDHAMTDGVRIPINDYFHVGADDMRFPHDWQASPENIVNCRCTCTYE